MAVTTDTKSQAMGIVNHAQGRIVTDGGAAAAHTINVGFVPRVIRVHNLTDVLSLEWHEGMADGSAIKTVAAGTRTLDADEGPTMGTEAAGTKYSFTLPAATMAASKTFTWEAIG